MDLNPYPFLTFCRLPGFKVPPIDLDNGTEIGKKDLDERLNKFFYTNVTDIIGHVS